jgi:predicted site-specific integrase-resolvase
MAKKLTLTEWNDLQPRPRSAETVRRWVRAGVIIPAPKLCGREYLFEQHAVKITSRSKSSRSLIQRITNVSIAKPR